MNGSVPQVLKKKKWMAMCALHIFIFLFLAILWILLDVCTSFFFILSENLTL
jgi:hypothetical protein